MNTKAKMRDTALATTRSIIREKGLDCNLETAEKVLDDYARTHPDTSTAYWWANANDNQWKLFKREWNRDAQKYGKRYK